MFFYENIWVFLIKMRRTKRYNISPSDDEIKEFERLYNVYKQQGGTLKITAWMKQKALKNGQVTIIQTIDNQELNKAILQLNKIGVNMNQVVKAMHTNKNKEPFISQIVSSLSVINDSIGQIMKHVDRS